MEYSIHVHVSQIRVINRIRCRKRVDRIVGRCEHIRTRSMIDYPVHTSKSVHERCQAAVQHFEERISDWVTFAPTERCMFLCQFSFAVHFVSDPTQNVRHAGAVINGCPKSHSKDICQSPLFLHANAGRLSFRAPVQWPSTPAQKLVGPRSLPIIVKCYRSSTIPYLVNSIPMQFLASHDRCDTIQWSIFRHATLNGLPSARIDRNGSPTLPNRAKELPGHYIV